MRRTSSWASVGRQEAGIINARNDLETAERRMMIAVNEAIDAGMTYERAAKLLGISRATLHRRYVQTQQTLRLGS